jgi:hypothetical protein
MFFILQKLSILLGFSSPTSFIRSATLPVTDFLRLCCFLILTVNLNHHLFDLWVRIGLDEMSE